MSTAEESKIGQQPVDGPKGSRRWAWAGLAVVLGGALALRLWGVGQGLPYAYNIDENDHFVPQAIEMFGHGLNPHYFANPPALTYLLHLVFAVWFGGRAGVSHAFAQHPGDVFVVARVTVAVLGTVSVWLLYLAGARLLGRGVGLLAAALEAATFLPVLYAHLALNDVPTLAPLTLSLLGTAGVLRKGRRIDYLLAGIGLGLGCATKYTAGIVILPLTAAAAAQYLTVAPDAGRRAVTGILIAGAGALVVFLIANPYSVLDFHGFRTGLVHQSTLSGEAQGKLGAPTQGGVLYYLWSLTWGLGWIPALAALGGAVTVWRADARLGWLLVPAPVLFLAFMGLQGRYFGRWLLPIFPIVCLLAAFFALDLAGAVARRVPRLRALRLRVVLIALVVVAVCGQGLAYSVHSDLVLSRADTRNLTRAWMLSHIPVGAKIVVEPVAPDEWARESPGAPACPRYRWCKYRSLLSRISSSGALVRTTSLVGIENYVRTLAPALIGYYEAHGFCWVVSGSTQSGRASADPQAVPRAIAYYHALAEQGEVVYRASPYARGQGPVAFNFDWSFDYYPLAYRRPGPQMTIYRLHGGRCRA